MRAAALLAALALAAGGCGGGDGLVEETVGDGPLTTTILRPAELEEPAPVVLFLHGWGATLPRYYRPWLEHLARGGNAVLYPRYQDSVVTPPPQTLGNALAGVRLALDAIEEDPDSLVVVGHSAGGALAADYAAVAQRVGLPVPRAVYSVYPGRSLRGLPARIPEIPGIPRDVRVVVAGSTADTIVGTVVARRIARAAPDGRYEEVRDPAVRDHLGPQRAGPRSRAVFWARLDRLIAAARGR